LRTSSLSKQRVRRLSSAGVLLVALLSATAAARAQTTGGRADRPPLAAQVESCTTSVLPAGRVVSFVGSMPALTGGERMQMRFDLERSAPGAPWRRLRGVEGFGTWDTAAPRRAGFVFHKRVDGLVVPASYRASVRFRWLDADGRVVRRARRRTAVCEQPDLRPNLVPGPLTAIFDGRPGLALYTIVVRNTGRTDAGRFSVRVGGATTEVAGVDAGSQRTVLVLSPICLAGTSTIVEVDPFRQVDESRERGNVVARRCPLWGA
jgi:hypothetical protein